MDVLKAQGWDQVFGRVWNLDGDRLPAIGLVIPENDWGGFASPEAGPCDTVAQAKGEMEAKAMWAAFNKHVKFVSGTVYHRHADLSC